MYPYFKVSDISANYYNNWLVIMYGEYDSHYGESTVKFC